MALQAKRRVSNGRNRVEDGEYTWSYELEYYRKYYSLFYLVYLGAAIPMCWLGKHIELKAETLGMTFVLLILGGLSITIGQSKMERANKFFVKRTRSLTSF